MDLQHKTDPMAEAKPSRAQIALRAVFVLLLAALIAASVGLYMLTLWHSGKWSPSPGQKAAISRMAQSSELMRQAETLKTDVKDLARSVRAQELDEAENARARMLQDIAQTRAVLDRPFWRLAARLPVLGEEVTAARELLQIAEDADSSVIGPALGLMRSAPLSALKADGGVRVDVLLQYLDLCQQVLPDAEALLQRLQNVRLRMLDQEDLLGSYGQRAEELLALGDEAADLFPVLRAVLGDGRDRLFLFAAQNSSEMRASGGFPGAVGTVRIRDGLLTLTDFASVYQVFQPYTPSEAAITPEEERLFSGRMHLPWDSDFSPDFERAASIWAMAYTARSGESVDGVISATPAVIQKLLSFLGSVTLSDGTVLNGDNATRVLGHDLYFKYLGAEPVPGGAEIVDALFAECAQKTFGLLMDRLDLQRLTDCYLFFRESVAERSMMLYLTEEQEQELVRRAGWNAGLNTDPMQPEIGIFFNSTDSSKMTWFLDITPELSGRTRNPDGSVSYDLTVTLSNAITEDERRQAGGYILGSGGGITGTLYVFAPCGGSIGGFETNNGRAVSTDSYEGLELGYLVDVTVLPAVPFVLRCTVTTAPGADAPVRLVLPPTMTAYR